MAGKTIYNNEYLNNTAVGYTPLSGVSGSTKIQSDHMDNKIKNDQPIIQNLLDGIHAQLDTITGIRHHLRETVGRILPIPNYPNSGECGPNNDSTVPSIVDLLRDIQEALKVEVSKLDEISNHLKTIV